MKLPSKTFDSDQIFIDLSISCSKEDAAAKLLGWLRGPILHQYIEVAPAGITVDQLKHISSLHCTIGGTLRSQLTELHTAALVAFEGANNGAELEDTANAVLYWEKQIRLAARYLRDIDDELAKDDKSVLRIDKVETEKSGESYLTLSSLDEWAQTKYKFSIFDDGILETEENVSKEIVATDKITQQDGLSFEEPINNQQSDIDPDGPDEVKNRILVNNIYLTLAFFLEAFSQTLPKYRKGTEPNCDAIASHFERAAIAANKIFYLYGHRSENLRKLFRKAVATKHKLGLKNTYPNGESIVMVEKENIDKFLAAKEPKKKN